ncbi:hypothetical protein AQUSIP_02830 [Aquicella siphonis]|uniref:Uncharacterized protein n=1 Tax=Aquicella siphonis TaxID=254247 RepID=A0A5E4PDJ5_9COXI|nr:replication-relaxation family protein [Aquicella siphonis]VVC75009.1 hypothetical protein AQUSIP_02830 [Aquicella siphonis]
MKMTQRDIDILEFINEFWFCEITQIEQKFDLKKPRSYQIMQRLIKEKLVIHERVFHGRNGIYYLSKQGASHFDLPAMSNVPIAIYDHQLAIIDIYFKLMHLHPEAQWISERRLKRERFAKGIGRLGHISDGLLVFPVDKQIAIEVELTMKGKLRLEKIFKAYASQLEIKEIWYFCSPEILPKMQKAAEKRPYIKIHRL